ncbi:OmpA family protein [Clostridium fallax]|uniref:Chemotaxis protein MotB n=1 Tax=Clostridium fallax TaxID=1533 RepID=A0A1M4UJC6_9CLOT|nr:OmpA family protein [Clostridium fallax]SHE56807.1 chemotaxis protein MotB [Clostridium fallax]SQB07596.1 chemotaxis protein MotB [Clostridium fallax]
MARKKKKGDGGVSGDEWLATYSDTITLLLTFFILLYTMSSVDSQKLKVMSAAMQKAFQGKGESVLEYNLHNGTEPIVGNEDIEKPDSGDTVNENDSAYNNIEQFVNENNLASDVRLTKDERGVILQIKDSILFESGKADLIESSREVLDKISKLLSSMPNKVIIEGHTDNLPINTYKFASNWELSAARAVNVVKYFSDNKKIDPTRFCAAGYGEYRPIVDNSTPDNRAKNRRVNILIVTNENKDSKQSKES